MKFIIDRVGFAGFMLARVKNHNFRCRPQVFRRLTIIETFYTGTIPKHSCSYNNAYRRKRWASLDHCTYTPEVKGDTVYCFCFDALILQLCLFFILRTVYYQHHTTNDFGLSLLPGHTTLSNSPKRVLLRCFANRGS